MIEDLLGYALAGAVVIGGTHWLDVVAKYGADPTGVNDSTTAIQTAVNDAVTLGGAVVYFRPGTYAINGAQQTGTAQGYNYSGQILFPAQPFTNSPQVSIRLAGIIPPPMMFYQIAPNNPIHQTGAILLSNATAGNVFDAIPSATNGGQPATDLSVTFESLTVRAPNNPQCGGINAVVLSTFASRRLMVDVNSGNGDQVTLPTGTGSGINLPGVFNQAFVQCAETAVFGYPVGITHYEHANLHEVVVQQCAVGVRVAAPGGHMSTYRLLCQECVICLQAQNIAAGGGAIHGRLDYEIATTGSFTSTVIIDDAGNKLRGRLAIYPQSATTKGYSVNGSSLLNIGNPTNGDIPWMSSWPVETFTRLPDNVTNNGITDQSNHPWIAFSSPLRINAGIAKSQGFVLAVMRYARRGSAIRTILASIATGPAGYDVSLVAEYQPTSGNYFWIRLNGGIVSINKTVTGVDTLLASSAAAAVAASTTYTVGVEVQMLTIGTAIITAFINGTQVVTYTLTGAEQTAWLLAPTANNSLWRMDGVRASDTTSSYAYIAITPGLG